MSQKNESEIKFRIQRIETLQFAIMQEEVTEDKLSYAVNFGYGIDAESLVVRSMFRYELLCETKSCLIIEVAVDFLIEPENFKENFIRDGKPFIEKGFASHLSMIAVGTTRGILHEKTKETSLNSFPIPTINVSKQITEDITFDEQ